VGVAGNDVTNRSRPWDGVLQLIRNFNWCHSQCPL